jgi:hypothetical protein
MFRLFRQLRQRLLTDNRFGKYLLYAIGEILLVVIGILLALQVGTWKENQALEKDRRLLLQNLRTDFELRKNELLEFDEVLEKEINSLEYLLPLFNNTENLPDPAVVDSLLAYSLNAYSFNDSFKLLDLLFNTGRIDLIETAELKSLLLKWPFLMEETLEEQRILGRVDVNIGFPELSRHLSYHDVSGYSKFRNYGFSSYASKIEKDYVGLFQNRAYENYLSLRLQLIRIMKTDRLLMIESAEKILELIQGELRDGNPDD